MTSATATFHEQRDPMILSYSGIATYQTCRERWKLQNVFGLKAPHNTKPMDVGSAVHAGLEYFLKGKGPAEEGITLWIADAVALLPEDDDGILLGLEELTQHFVDVKSTALQVISRAIDEIQRRELKPVYLMGDPLIEAELMVPIPGWDGYAAHLDAVMKDPNGFVWIVDFKVRGTFQNEESEYVNLQNASYQKMLFDVYGIEAAGSLTFQIRSTPMTKPKPTKNGLSRARIVCDWGTYRQAVIDAGYDPADYAEMEAKLADVEWTSVLTAYRSMDFCNRAWDAIIAPLGFEMAKVRDRLMSPTSQDRRVGARQCQRNMSVRTCTGCNVRDVCLASLRGFDVTDALRPYTFRQPIVADAVERGLL